MSFDKSQIITIGDLGDIENIQEPEPLAETPDTNLKLKIQGADPTFLQIGDSAVRHVIDGNLSTLYGTSCMYIHYNKNFFYVAPYALGSESRVVLTMARDGNISSAGASTIMCSRDWPGDGTSGTPYNSFTLFDGTTSRDDYGTSQIVKTQSKLNHVYKIDKNKNITIIDDITDGTREILTHPKQEFRSSCAASFGISYSGTNSAITNLSNNTPSTYVVSSIKIYDYDKLLFDLVLMKNGTRYKGLYAYNYHFININKTSYVDINGDTQNIGYQLCKIRKIGTNTEGSYQSPANNFSLPKFYPPMAKPADYVG